MPESFAPGDVVDQVLQTCALPEGFTLRQEIDLAVIHCVMVEFEIALRNMLQNAIRHHDRRTGTLVIRVTRDDSLFRIEVQDDGPGIPDTMKPKVLLPLRTGKTREQGGGTGLGLAFIAKIADRRGGQLELLDAPERGLIVRLTLPVPPPGTNRPTGATGCSRPRRPRCPTRRRPGARPPGGCTDRGRCALPLPGPPASQRSISPRQPAGREAGLRHPGPGGIGGDESEPPNRLGLPLGGMAGSILPSSGCWQRGMNAV